jgi:uncharacterized protein YuzE
MKEPYLEVTFRHGRPMAGYLYLPRSPEDRSFRTSRRDPGLVIDFNRDGKPIGIEITAPTQIVLDDLNRVLTELGVPLLETADLLPLRAA